MRAEVTYAEERAGWLSWEPDAYGVQVEVDCVLPPDAPLLRCYGETGGEPLLVGLPAPENGRLQLRRHLSRETLKAAGCADGPPMAFYLAERPRPPDASEQMDGAEKTADPEPPHEQPMSDAPPAPEPSLRTGDSVLDALLERGEVCAERMQQDIRLHCAFAPDQPFALAPAFVLCRVEADEAVLDWTKKDAADGAASAESGKIT